MRRLQLYCCLIFVLSKAYSITKRRYKTHTQSLTIITKLADGTHDDGTDEWSLNLQITYEFEILNFFRFSYFLVIKNLSKEFIKLYFNSYLHLEFRDDGTYRFFR